VRLAQEAIYSLLMLEHGFIAPSINIDEMDEQAAGLNIVTKPTDATLTPSCPTASVSAVLTPRW
jgi:3-oxoacyl-(acyl-carrier-protein) synthase